MSRVSFEHLDLLFEKGVTPMRAGIIPFTRDSTGNLWWLMGVTHAGQLTDFGGGCHVKDKETPVEGALREFREEVGVSTAGSTVGGTVGNGLSMLYAQIVANIKDADRTSVIEMPARNNPLICRYFFHVHVDIPLACITDFRPTEEIKLLAWYPPQLVLNMDASLVSGSCIAWVRYMTVPQVSRVTSTSDHNSTSKSFRGGSDHSPRSSGASSAFRSAEQRYHRTRRLRVST